jgi:putative flavoprotein involved in K+ transport
LQPHDFRVAEDRIPPRVVTRAATRTIEAMIAFDTAAGRCSGVVRLVPDPTEETGLCAWLLLTALDELKGHEERIGGRRPDGRSSASQFGGANWLDRRHHDQAYSDHEPTVLVVGAGQAGLGIAASLGHLGVDTLLIDRHERVGDAWRKRYHSLVLHNKVHVNHLPYMPFPPNTPTFIAKDKLANWFEFYADAMDLNVWTGTEIVSGIYDDELARWKVAVRRSDGSERIVRPRHLVFATGVSGIKNQPALPGIESFAGAVMHSGDYTDGRAWNGRKALVLGTGNSAHDVAQDLHCAGAAVTMIQRGTSTVISLEQAQRVYDIYKEGRSLEDCDLLGTANPYPVQVKVYRHLTQMAEAADKELLEGLKARGFGLDSGSDGTGYQMKYLRQGGGYYFNVGCSDLIVSGDIGLLRYDQIERFVPTGVQLRDGKVFEADLLVMATGYKNQQELIRQFLGDGVADAIGPIWGIDPDGEQRNIWRRTAQPGLWFTAGGLPHVRIYSRYLALQIKAVEEGLMRAGPPARGPEPAEAGSTSTAAPASPSKARRPLKAAT